MISSAAEVPGAHPPSDEPSADSQDADSQDADSQDGDRTARSKGRPDPAEPVTLPSGVRRRVVAVAADALGVLAPEEIPGALRPFARFTPARRAKLAVTPIAATLEADQAFRERIAARIQLAYPDLAAALADGSPPPAADPVDVAAAAYVLRAPGWQGYVAEAGRQEEQTVMASAKAAAEASVGRLHDELAAARHAVKAEQERSRSALEHHVGEVDEIRRQLRAAQAAVRRAEAAMKQAQEEAVSLRAAAESADAEAEAENRRLRDRVAELEVALEAGRRLARADKNLGDIRLRLLLDTLLDATQGLRRELALPPLTGVRPADTVAAAVSEAVGPGDLVPRALAGDDPAVLDELLALPQVHLVVDGYNVTKGGYPSLPLAEQRLRLVSGLAVLAAQTRAEMTCVFDGAEIAGPVPSAAPRGVRVLFSKPGETADELIRRLVRAEPPGRPVVVVSSDREVAEGVRRSGARAVPSGMLLRRLSRA